MNVVKPSDCSDWLDEMLNKKLADDLSPVAPENDITIGSYRIARDVSNDASDEATRAFRAITSS